MYNKEVKYVRIMSFFIPNICSECGQILFGWESGSFDG